MYVGFCYSEPNLSVCPLMSVTCHHLQRGIRGAIRGERGQRSRNREKALVGTRPVPRTSHGLLDD